MNLKQSRFNSSCLSAPGQRQGGRLGSLAGADQPTEGPRRRRNRADRRGDAPEDTSPHTNTPLSLQSPAARSPLFSPPIPSLLCRALRVFFPPLRCLQTVVKSYIFRRAATSPAADLQLSPTAPFCIRSKYLHCIGFHEFPPG